MTTITRYYLIIGRSNAGKTTYARNLLEKFLEDDVPAVIIDGDGIRNLYDNCDYSNEGRWKNIIDSVTLAYSYMNLGITPIIAMICPRNKYRDFIIDKLGKGILIYLEGGTLWEGTTFEEPDKDKWIFMPDWRLDDDIPQI